MSDTNGYSFSENEMASSEEGHFGFLTDAEDHEILMHREIHFGGNFQVMLDYYARGGVGVNPNFDVDRIQYLQAIEEETHQNLAALLLTASEAERVGSAKETYRKFKEIYEIKNPDSPYPRLIADLILSEEEEPTAEIDAVVRAKEKIVPHLIQLLNNNDAYDALYPGYGFAPYLAIQCLALIRSEKAIRPLFETLSREMLFEDEVILEAFREIGPSALHFLIKMLKGRPFTKDNIQAAYALSAFSDQMEVALAAFEELKDPSNWEKKLYCSYLLSLCLFLLESDHREEFLSFAKLPTLPDYLKKEISDLTK